MGHGLGRDERESGKRDSETIQGETLRAAAKSGGDDTLTNLPPNTVYRSLLDRQVRYCSISTMYRLLRRGGQSSCRRQRRQRVCHVKPQLKAMGPNQVWSWDIILLKGPIRGVFYYLYVMVDIYSRKVVAWMLAKREGEDLARNFIAQAYKREGVKPGQLTVHSDRGPSMKSLGVADLHRWLGIHQSFGRPSVSDDNPYSEAFFKTFKHCPAFPGRFESFEAAEKFCVRFFAYYNDKHYHSGIFYLTPNTVHNGLADSVLEARHLVEFAHYEANPKRYPAGSPKRKMLQESYWIVSFRLGCLAGSWPAWYGSPSGGSQDG